MKAWEQFLSEIQDARADLGNPTTVWYRGHAASGWSLTPNLLRDPADAQHEQEAFREFQRSASRLFEKREDDWETLFDMQHYGIPTRLLDWSEVLGIAVAFVLLQEYLGDSDSSVFVLDPLALNQKSGLMEVPAVPDNKKFKYREIYWDQQPFAAQHPIAIYPPLLNERMRAQKATFTAHGLLSHGLEQQCPDVVRKVNFPTPAKDGARAFLEHADINAYSIFPDIHGMAQHIRRQVFGK